MKHVKPDQHFPMSALDTTAADLARCLTVATGPKFKRVIDEDTGETVGQIVPSSICGLKWITSSSWGYAETVAECLTDMAPAVLREREWQAEHDAMVAEIDALPEPLRSLRWSLEEARTRCERERQRNVIRPADLARREIELEQAEAAYAAEARKREAA